jgi:hypothetical protein
MTTINTSLILLSGWDPPVVAQFALERQAELKAALSLYTQPIETQEQADEVAALIGECERWESDIESASAEVRKAYFDHGKLIKATTDACQRVIIDARRPVQQNLANFEAEKLRVKQHLAIQAAKEAEATGQPVKPVTWEAPKTEGVTAGTELEWEVADERTFAEWCWANGLRYWVRRIEFDKRLVNDELAKVPDTAPVPQIPGLTIRRVASVRVRKAKKPSVINVASTRVEL